MSKEISREVFVGSLSIQGEDGLSLTRVLEAEAIRGKIKEVNMVLGGEHSGQDTLIQLANLAFGFKIEPEDIKTNGFAIDASDHFFAEEFGYVILPIACAKLTKGKIEAWISPALVSKKHPLVTQALKSDSAVVITTGEIDDEPIDVSTEMFQLLGISKVFHKDLKQIFLEEMSDEVSEKIATHISSQRSETDPSHYVRLTVKNDPGVLASVCKQFGNANISIRMVKQPEVEEGSETASLAFVLRPCEQKILEKCVALIQNLDVCVGVGSVLRVVE